MSTGWIRFLSSGSIITVKWREKFQAEPAGMHILGDVAGWAAPACSTMRAACMMDAVHIVGVGLYINDSVGFCCREKLITNNISEAWPRVMAVPIDPSTDRPTDRPAGIASPAPSLAPSMTDRRRLFSAENHPHAGAGAKEEFGYQKDPPRQSWRTEARRWWHPRLSRRLTNQGTTE